VHTLGRSALSPRRTPRSPRNRTGTGATRRAPDTRASGSHAAEPAGVPPSRTPIPRPIAPCSSVCRVASLLALFAVRARQLLGATEPSQAAAYRSCHRRELRQHSHTPPPAALQPPCNYPGSRCPARTPDPPARRALAGAAPAPRCGSSPTATPAPIPPQIDVCEPPRYSGHLLRPSPAAAGPEFGRRRGQSAPRDYIAREKVFSGRFMQVSRDPTVKVILGLQQQLQKIIKNRRKNEKCKTNFVGFVVKKPIFSRKHV
jgi:hypothetical protein